MSTFCAWAYVENDSAHDNYADHVAQIATRSMARAWHFTAEQDPSLEFVGSGKANCFTIYQVPDAAEHEPSSGGGHLMPTLISRVPEHVHIIDSCYCEELYDFQAQGYAGDFVDARFLAVSTFLLKDDATFKSYYDWTNNWMIPRVLKSPEFLRGRYYKRKYAGPTDESPAQEKECMNMSLYEMNTEDWLWDVFDDISDQEHWRSMENNLDFAMAKWYLKASYPGDGQASTEKQQLKKVGAEE